MFFCELLKRSIDDWILVGVGMIMLVLIFCEWLFIGMILFIGSVFVKVM